jgi:hypothetical protein
MSFAANTYGNIQLTLDATALAIAPRNGTSIFVDVAKGRPMNEALLDILSALGIARADAFPVNNSRPNVKLQDAGATDFDMALTFAQQGVREGDTILIEDV